MQDISKTLNETLSGRIVEDVLFQKEYLGFQCDGDRKLRLYQSPAVAFAGEEFSRDPKGAEGPVRLTQLIGQPVAKVARDGMGDLFIKFGDDFATLVPRDLISPLDGKMTTGALVNALDEVVEF